MAQTTMGMGMQIKMQMFQQKSPSKSCVLIVDDDEAVARIMKRRMISFFDEVIISTTLRKIDEQFKHNNITHVLCDYYLGESEENGIEVTGFSFVEFWRRKFPTIKRAVIFSGSDLSHLSPPAEVDEVVSKTSEIFEIVEAVLGYKVIDGKPKKD